MIQYYYHIRPMFRGGFSITYFASRCPFVKLKAAKISTHSNVYYNYTQYLQSGNELRVVIAKIKTVNPPFARFCEIKYP